MPSKFVLLADDNCDLPYDYYENNDIAVLNMKYGVDDTICTCHDRTVGEFYDLIREGKRPTTMAANVEEIKQAMEPHVIAGNDVLYLAFSSGLSATFNNGVVAAKELLEKYPDRKIMTVDSLCASMGEGLFLHHANKLRQTGASIDEVSYWALENRLHVAHYVMADDLMHLHRGGRVSKTSAIAGSMLGIKPVIYMDNEGKLLSIDKVRGKKQALTEIVNKMEKVVGNFNNDYFMISHADCLEDAEFAAELMKRRFGIKDYLINYIGPVIGSHTGVGTVALFLMANRR